MKNRYKIFLLISAGCFAFTACTKDDDQSGDLSDPMADYTIMMYGCGGGNLDSEMLYNLGQVAGYGYSSKVQFAAKLKFSNPYQKKDPVLYGGTRLYTLTEKGMENENVGSQGFRMDDPQNLADFITATKKRLPAKQYILVLWNHGSEFGIKDQLVSESYPEKMANTKAIVFDDNTKEEISIFEMEEAFKRANTKLDLLYMDVCLMHNMENICQIKDYTRYVLGAAHLTPGLGGNYAMLMHILEHNSNLLEAMRDYIPVAVNHWIDIEGIDPSSSGNDLTLTDMNYVEEVAQNMKSCIDGLIAYRDSLEPGSQAELYYQYRNGTQQNIEEKQYPYYSKGGLLYYFYNKAYSVDMLSAFTRIGNLPLDGKLSAQITKLKLAVDKMIPISDCAGTPNFLNRVSVGINWVDKDAFTKQYSQYPIPTLEGLYAKLRFDQITGWSRFLKINIRKNVEMRIVKNPETGAEEEEYYEVMK